MIVIPLRLGPGADLKRALNTAVRDHDISAGWIMSCVGSLERITLRLADIHTAEGDYEIISAAGTLSPTGLHVHLAVADPTGTLIGGHLLGGCVVSETGTVELVIGADSGWRFGRAADPQTGFDELTIDRSTRE